MPGTANQPLATLIGDVVSSREHRFRQRLHLKLKHAFDHTNGNVQAVQPLAPTVGDEFQAVYFDLASAFHVALRLRLLLLPDVDVRFGVGWGDIRILDRERIPFEQDGPGWWAARRAIENLESARKRNETPRGWRTMFALPQPGGHNASSSVRIRLLPESEPTRLDVAQGVVRTLNSFLVCRDELVGNMTERDVRILLHLFAGRTQGEIARLEKVTQSAISQRILRSGAYAILQSDQTLETVAQWQ